MNETKYVYSFGGGSADGRTDMKNLLGGKGANLAEMASLGIPVPAGFTLTTEVCTYYYDHDRSYPSTIEAEVDAAMAKVEEIMGTKFGDPKDPLLHQHRDRVLHAGRLAVVREARREPLQPPTPRLDLSQHQPTGVRGGAARIEPHLHPPATERLE